VAEQPVLQAISDIEVSQQQARAWFLSLADHPERYTFDSHAGFTFTEGEFGEPGARFQTTERFQGLTVTLKFKLTDVAQDRFTFSLLAPVRGIWGYFELQPAGAGATRLVLAIGSRRRLQRGLLKLPLIRRSVQQQIEGEVAHIKQSMEELA
jgi:hypothetical protein